MADNLEIITAITITNIFWALTVCSTLLESFYIWRLGPINIPILQMIKLRPRGLKNFPKIIQQVNDSIMVSTQAVCLQSVYSQPLWSTVSQNHSICKQMVGLIFKSR